MLIPALRRLPTAAALLAAALGAAAPPAPAADCNGNGIDDFAEVESGQEPDCDGNGVPDLCDILQANHGLAFRERLLSREAGQAASAAASSLIAEDLDRDGHADLAVLSSASSVAGILWGDGLGGFSAPDSFPAGKSVVLAAGDVDGDGRVDLAGGSSDGVLFLHQSEARRFSGRVSLRAASTRGALALADLDGDDDLDLTLAGRFEVLIFRGNGSGAFGEPDDVPAGSGPIHIALADVDGDGDIDIATVNSLDDPPVASVSAFLNRGTGIFGPARNYAVGSAPSSLAAGDLDGDGRADLVVTNSGSADVSVFLAREDGTFAAQRRLATGGAPLAAALADLDGDGDADIAVSRGWDAADPLAGGAVTTFRTLPGGAIRRGFELRVGGTPVSIAARDLVGGEAPEVAVADAASGDIEILEEALVANHGDCDRNLVPDVCDIFTEDCNANGLNDLCDATEGRSRDCNRNRIPDECEPDCNRNIFPDDCDVSSRWSLDCNGNLVPDECELRHGSLRLDVTSMGAAILSMMALDLDGDGWPDLAGLDLSERLAVSWNGGGGALEPPAAVAPAAPGSPLAAGDLDGDGDVDLAAGDARSTAIRALLQSPPRTFSAGMEIALEEPPGSIAAADIDGDGLVDIAAVDASGDILVFGGAGDGAVRPPRSIAAGAAPGFLAARDIDGDGARDIACILAGGAPAILWNRGEASFGEPAALPAVISIRAPAIGDIDRDGDLDLAAVEGDDVILLLQAGPRDFDRTSLFGSLDVAALALADADLDGLDDLIAAHGGALRTGLEVRRGDGEGSFAAPHTVPAPVGLDGIAVIDVDRTGSPDIVAAFLDTPCPQCPRVGRVFLWRNLTLPPASRDIDRNGRPDECDPGAFRRGDSDSSGALDLADAVFTLRALFQGGPAPGCAEAADADNDGSVGLTDPVSVLDFLFRGGPPPAAPGPPPGPCGLDADAPGSGGDLGCADYEGC